MSQLPAESEKRLVRALGAYLRSVPANELPGPLRALRNFTPSALVARRKQVLSAADDQSLRDRIVEWLDEDKHRLADEDAGLLRAFAERPDGWEERIAALAPTAKPAPRRADDSTGAQQRLERERERTRKAKDDLQRARAVLDRTRRELRSEIAELKRRIDDLERHAAELTSERDEARRALERATDRLDKQQRKARRAADEAQAEREKLRGELRAERRATKDARTEADRARAELARARARPRDAAPPAQGSARARAAARRKPLAVPKGRPGDDPDTLDDWLTEPGVQLLIDGYNVTKSLGGYGALSLEKQRERLVQDVGRFTRRRRVTATIVFDGAARSPGGARPSRSPVAVEYSRPPENADDHLIARLRALPPDPVVVITNDRELRDRARKLGATVASSSQFLSLIRP